MDSKVQSYLEAAYEQLEKGGLNLEKSEEILAEQRIFLKVGLMSQEEYEFWNQKFQSIYPNPTDLMTLSTRSRNALSRACVDTYGKLRYKILYGSDDRGLMRVRNLGNKTVREIIAEALECGLITKTELLEAPWTPGDLKKVQSWLEESGL